MAWICAGRPPDGYDLTFETLRRLSQLLVRFMLPSACLAPVTFRAALRHVRDSSRRFFSHDQ